MQTTFLPHKFDDPTLISFSGGRTSGFMLYKILEAYDFALPDYVHVVFANTGKEMPETLDFVHKCSVEWNCKINWLELEIAEERPIYRTKEVSYETASRQGEPFAALIDRKNMLPNPFQRFCTQEMKVNVMKRFMVQKGYKEWNNVIGLRYDEPRRVAKQKGANESGKNKWESLMPLYDARLTLQDVSKFWKDAEFDLSLPSFDGKTLAGNCDMCFLKGKRTLIALAKERPDLADWWIEQEQKVFTSRTTGESSTATFRKNMEFIECVNIATKENSQPMLFEDDGRSCFCHD